MLTERLVGEPGGVVEAVPGRQLPRPRWADAIESASGVRAVLVDDLQVPAQAGAYFLDRAGRRVGALVANPDPAESMLERFGPDDLTRRITAQRVLNASDRAQFTRMAFRAAARRSVLEPLLAIALILLLLEAVLVRVGHRTA